MKTQILTSYRTGEYTYVYNVIIDYLGKKAAQGYRVIPISKITEYTRFSPKVIKDTAHLHDLPIEDYGEFEVIRLVPVEEPYKETDIGLEIEYLNSLGGQWK